MNKRLLLIAAGIGVAAAASGAWVGQAVLAPLPVIVQRGCYESVTLDEMKNSQAAARATARNTAQLWGGHSGAANTRIP